MIQAGSATTFWQLALSRRLSATTSMMLPISSSARHRGAELILPSSFNEPRQGKRPNAQISDEAEGNSIVYDSDRRLRCRNPRQRPRRKSCSHGIWAIPAKKVCGRGAPLGRRARAPPSPACRPKNELWRRARRPPRPERRPSSARWRPRSRPICARCAAANRTWSIATSNSTCAHTRAAALSSSWAAAASRARRSSRSP